MSIQTRLKNLLLSFLLKWYIAALSSMYMQQYHVVNEYSDKIEELAAILPTEVVY
jgi:hypothetical protein